MSGSRAPAIAAWTLVLVGIGVLAWLWFPEGDDATTLSDAAIGEKLELARKLIGRREYREARAEADDVLESNPDHVDALIVAAEAATGEQRFAAAMDYYGRVPKDKSAKSLEAAYAIADLQFRYGTFAEAERGLQDVLRRDSSHVAANTRMTELMDLEGRRLEAVRFGLEVARQGVAGLVTLTQLADQEQIIGRTRRMKRANDRDQNDPGPLLGLSRAAFWEGERRAAELLTRRVIELRPGLLEAHIRLGGILLEKDSAEFLEWHSNLSERAETHPDLWMFRGRWAKQVGQTEAAARCFWESVKRNPNNQAAVNQLGQVLNTLGRSDEANPFLKRGDTLGRLRKLIDGVYVTGRRSKPETLTEVADVMQDLGRTIEAAAWRRGVQPSAKFPDFVPVTQDSDVTARWVEPASNPAMAIDLSGLPLPEFDKTSGTASGAQSGSLAARFEDKAVEVGIDFTFIPAPDDTTEGKRIIELTGGGVAAVDFDLDLWPDVLLTQGGRFPVEENTPHRDRLYRNGGGSFVDVTTLAGIEGPGFGQGVAAGDVNGDGFPDLYVANIGRNQLYLNNGDGTFTDASHQLPDARTDWSTSVAIADVNRDGLPDLYVVNYLTGEDIYVICQTDGKATMCSPDRFDGAQDRFYLNRGDGTFEDVTESCGIVIPDGKGLGILAADFDGSGSLEFFIANDTVPNFFFATEPSSATFTEQSASLGVAVSGEGIVQGCMGIAAGDPNLDGRLDFFVTNFDGESNAMYTNLAGAFEDTARSSNLRGSSFRLVGFGTQFVDGELDGLEDLLIVNGHIDDFRHTSAPGTVRYRMPPQYLRNEGGSRFREVPAAEAGEFFSREQLGRSMARLDWNRDGRDDVAISHLDSPAALLTNTTERTGNSLSVRLVGTAVARDATGAVVWIRDGDWQRMQQLTGGSGYQASNDRRLTFGLGERTVIPKMEVRWLDGSVEEFEDVPAGAEFQITQGRGEILELPQ